MATFSSGVSASVASSCVRSVILTDERFLHFQLRQDKGTSTSNFAFAPKSLYSVLTKSHGNNVLPWRQILKVNPCVASHQHRTLFYLILEEPFTASSIGGT